MRWSYKTVHFGLKKDGLLGSSFLDEAEIEISLNEYGHAGWELVSFMEVNDGLIAVFKQPMGRLSVSYGETVPRDETEVLAESRAEEALPASPSRTADPDEEQGGDTGEEEGEEVRERDNGAGAGSIRIL